jgi:UDP-3-O-[3-hydroxymyristoyl] glucosamine N-acyltransferase
VQHIHQPKMESKLSPQPNIHDTSHIIDSYAGEWTLIGPSNKINESRIGDYTYTMDDVTINYTEIGKYCSIASHVCINPVDHPVDRVTIGHDVWIGHGAIIMKGVHIGTGAVVASGAVVTENVDPYTIVGGVPAKQIKERFFREIAAKLLEIKWWDWPREVLQERFYELNDINSFLEKYGVEETSLLK